MRQYSRARQKRNDLNSINEYTITEFDERRIHTRRPNQGKTLSPSPKDDGATEHQSGRDGQAYRSSSNEYQSSDVQKECCEHRFSVEDGGEHRAGCGIENTTERAGEAA